MSVRRSSSGSDGPTILAAATTLARSLEAHGAHVVGEGDVVVEFPYGLVRLRVRAPDAPAAFARFAGCSLAYVIEGDVRGHEDRARALVLLAAECVGESETSTSSSGRSSGVGRSSVEPVGAAELAQIVDDTVSTHRGRIERWASGARAAVPGPSPCLAQSQRPPTPGDLGRPTRDLVVPCNSCGVASACELASSISPHHASLLRPLRHRNDLAAARAAIERTCAVFEAEVPERIDGFLQDVSARRRAMPNAVPTPLELSVKVANARLIPSVRVVEYAPLGGEDQASRVLRAEALERVVVSACPVAEDSTAAWFRSLARNQRRHPEMSVGLDVPLLEPAMSTVQAYAHVDPSDRASMRVLLADALAWGGVAQASHAGILKLLDLPGNVRDAGARPALTLYSLSPSARDPRRIKLYFAAPLALAHAASGLEAFDPGPLSPFAPSWGLAVLEVSQGRAVWKKRDFPNLAHFQRAAPSVAAFAAQLQEPDAASLLRLFDGEAFAPWPTWLSMGEQAWTYYYVPR